MRTCRNQPPRMSFSYIRLNRFLLHLCIVNRTNHTVNKYHNLIPDKMKKEKFSINIKASAKKVWQVLWSDATYRQWTSAFSEGSYAVSDWKQGSKIQFLSPNGDG